MPTAQLRQVLLPGVAQGHLELKALQDAAALGRSQLCCGSWQQGGEDGAKVLVYLHTHTDEYINSSRRLLVKIKVNNSSATTGILMIPNGVTTIPLAILRPLFIIIFMKYSVFVQVITTY